MRQKEKNSMHSDFPENPIQTFSETQKKRRLASDGKSTEPAYCSMSLIPLVTPKEQKVAKSNDS